MKQGAGCRVGPSSWWLGGEVTDLGTHTQFSRTQSVPGQPWGLPCMCHLTLYVAWQWFRHRHRELGKPLDPRPQLTN